MMSYIRLLLMFLIAFASTISRAQISLFQDSKGESPYKTSASIFVLTTSTTSFDLATSFNLKRDRNNKWVLKLPIGISLKAEEGTSTILSEGKVPLDGSLSLGINYKILNNPAGAAASAHNIFILSKVISSNSQFFNNQLTDNVLDKVRDWGIELEGGYYMYEGVHIRGVSITYSDQNNLSKLKSYTVETEVMTIGSNLRAVRSQTAYDYEEFQKSFREIAFNLLIGKQISTNNPIFLTLNTNIDISPKLEHDISIGVHIGKPGAPSSIVGGFSMGLNNAFGSLSFQDKINIAFIGGYKF